ncbi:MAG: 50S ribosomal protein L15 [Hyphomonadaceae bacterium]|nr:MAG: large subunit ribosomal protein L15 [Caulobacteraceae bacterium]MBT9447491.1 50S ribosomal protein L15 [Hyphomonadaceae bacterium]TPW08500.1 MAG: large subunit ribosomal protein L15 [Alphaproteobacteria bacterium]
MSRLNEITDNPGATKNRMRVGRGVGSGKGKTCGRGVKGQKSRGGVSINGFEGGQMPIHMRAPKRGFNSLNRARYAEVNLYRLQKAIDAGKIDTKKDVDEAALVAAGLVRRVRDGVRLLAQGDLKTKVKLVVTGATAAAISAVEKAGGSVTVTKPVVAAEATA